MHTRHTRKAKSAAADFVKRVISGHDTSPGPSSKPKTQTTKAKQSAKSGDVSRSPSRGRSPAASNKMSPAAKAKGTKSSGPGSAKASPSAKEVPSTSSKAPEASKTKVTEKVKTVKFAEKVSTAKSTAPKISKSSENAAKVKEQNQVVPEVITIKSEDEESDSEKAEKKTENEIAEVQVNVEVKQEEDSNQDAAEHQTPSAEVPVKRGRGRPRKIHKGVTAGAAVKTPTVKISAEVKAAAAAPTVPSTSAANPLVPGKRPRGRPRKYPPGMSAAMCKTKEEKQLSSPKIRKTEHRYYSQVSKLPMGGGGIGALTIKIKDDYMLQEGGMVSPRHPTILCEQDEFFKIFGLIKKSELDEMNRRTHTLHRAVGGKLRRLIKPKICPEMVYRNFMLNKSTALGVVPDEWDSSDEYDESSPMAKLVKSHSAPTTPADHRSLIGSPSKVSLLGTKDKSLLKPLKAGQWNSPEDGTGPKKQWLKPPPKTPKRSSIEDALEAAKKIPKDVAAKHKKMDKPTPKKQKSDPTGKTKVVKLEVKSKSLEPGKGKNSASSSYRFKPSGGFRPLAPPPKILEEEDPTSQPSRRSARNRGSQRKQWWHLLRANPDEYIPDHEWDEEVAAKEQKKQEKIQRRIDDDIEEVLDAEEEVKIEPGEVVEKPKKKKRKKVKELLTEEEMEILEAEERAMEERQKKEEKVTIKSPIKKALKRKLDPEGSEERPAKLARTEGAGMDDPLSPTGMALKKRKKKKKKPKDRGKFHYLAKVDRRGSVLTIQKGSKCKDYMIFDSDFNLVSVHDDSNMYQLTANALVQLARQEGWGNLGQEVIEIVLPNKLVKEKLRSQICERMAPTSYNAQVEREKSCITPHMCQVCWINDHMYCANMKRTGRHLLQGGGCLHYTLCSHYRNLSPKETYARFATVAQFGSGGITKNFSISRLKDREFANSSKHLSEEGTSITISGGKLLAPGGKGDGDKESQVTITVNNAAKVEVQDKNPPQKAEDLVCHEELGESDSELPSTPGGDGTKSDLLTKHLWVRARQIAQSLGFNNIKEAMEAMKKTSEIKKDPDAENEEEVMEISGDECDVPVQDYVEVELEEFSDSDSDYEEEISKKRYGVPLSTKVRTCSQTTAESVIKIHLMPVLDRSRTKFYVKCKDRKIMKVQFGGRAHYREEDQEWKVESDTYTMKDVTRKYHKKMNKFVRTKRSESPIEEKSPVMKERPGDSQDKDTKEFSQSKTAGSPRVIWSSELDLEGQSPGKSKSSPEQPPAKKKKLSAVETMQTPKRKPEDCDSQSESFRSPEIDALSKQDRSADSSPCLSQGSAASHTSTSSAQGQQLLMASPVKLPKPSTSVPAELQNHVSSSKDGAQMLTFTTKDIRQCKPELIQYIKSANLIDMIHKTLTDERNSIEKLLKDGDGDVSRLKDNLEQNECLLLAVRSEEKEVKEKLVDLEMSVITEQNKANRLERRKTKLSNMYDSAHKKMSAFKKAMGKVQSLIEDKLDADSGAGSSHSVGYTLLKLAEGSVNVPEGATIQTLNAPGDSNAQTSGGILTAASAAAQHPGTVAIETIVTPPVSVVNI